MSLLKAGRPSNKKEKAIASVKDTGEGTIRMNVNISKTLHKQIKQRALDEDITVTELVIKSLNTYLSK